VQITRFPNLTESQFAGCLAAFVDSLAGELNAAAMWLRKLEGAAKGSAFAFEMSLDTHRYGALIVLDRWAAVVKAFGADPALARHAGAIDGAPERIAAAEKVLAQANHVIDVIDRYSPEAVEGCVLGFQSAQSAFAEERRMVEQSAALGPMLPDDYRQARRILLEDLTAR